MHTEGKIKASPINKSGFIIITKELNDDDEIMIDLMVHDGKEENGIANAARIVKTWNMHDELVAQNEKSLKALEIILQEAERVSMLVNFEHWTAEFRTQWYANTLVAEKEIDDLKSLLQQAK